MSDSLNILSTSITTQKMASCDTNKSQWWEVGFLPIKTYDTNKMGPPKFIISYSQQQIGYFTPLANRKVKNALKHPISIAIARPVFGSYGLKFC